MISLFSFFVASSLAVILYFLLNFNKKNTNFWLKNGLRIAKNGNFIVNMFFAKDFNFIKQEMNYYSQLKPNKIGGIIEFGTPVLYVLDLDILKHIYIKDFDNFVNHLGFNVEKQDPHMHFNLFNLEGDTWKSVRSKMSPTFTTGKIKRMFPTFVSSSKKLTKALDSQLEKSAIFEIRPFLQKLTMDVIASVAFGVETNLFVEKDSQFAKMGQRIQNQFNGLKMVKFMFVMLFPKLSQFLNLRLLDQQADEFMSDVIKQTLRHREGTGEKREDFLQLMMEARSGKLKNEEDSHGPESLNTKTIKQVEFNEDIIIAQSIGFILGGFDTVESLLVWTIYELACNQQVQDKLYHELRDSADQNGGEFSYESINEMIYLDKVILESLRKYPATVRTERKAIGAYKIPGTDVTIPKDMAVSIPIYPIHHDDRHWPQPEKFDPERFSKENSANRHPIAFQPFGAGPRMCIAQRFALSEGKSVIAHLILNFKFEPTQKTLIPPKFAVTTTVKYLDDLWLKVTSRR